MTGYDDERRDRARSGSSELADEESWDRPRLPRLRWSAWLVVAGIVTFFNVQDAFNASSVWTRVAHMCLAIFFGGIVASELGWALLVQVRGGAKSSPLARLGRSLHREEGRFFDGRHSSRFREPELRSRQGCRGVVATVGV